MTDHDDVLLRDHESLRAENARLKAVEVELAKAVESLKASDDRLRLAVQAANIGIWEWSIASDRVRWDAKKHEVFGLEQGSFAGTKEAFFDLVHPDDRQALAVALTQALDNHEPYQNEFRIIGVAGDTRWISNLGQVSRDDDGRPIRMIGVVHDVTERRLSERSLRHSEERFRSFVETTSEWIWEVDVQGLLTYSNPVVEAILGYRPDELYGRSLASYVHADDLAVVLQVLGNALAKKQGWTGLSIRCQHRDQSYRRLECHGLPVLDESGEVIGFRGSDRDVTDRWEADQLRVDAQRMQGIGRLAGGFAHHFNNLLAIIIGNVDLALEITSDSRVRDDLQSIRAAAQRGALLTRQLLAFARRQSVAPRVVDLGTMLPEMKDRLQRRLGDGIDLTIHVDPGLFTITVDPVQLEIVLSNLIINAKEAMPEGGVLAIKASNLSSSAADAPHEPEVMPGDYVVLSVTDTGTGMSKEVAEKVFEPFFTTKSIGSEMVGLGLSTAYGIVAQQGGHIRVQSAINGGTTFRVFLRRTPVFIAPT